MIINGKEISKALYIKSHWGNLILDGTKSLEIRSSNTKVRGTIALIFSGTNKIWGTIDLVDTLPIADDEFDKLNMLHRINISRDDISYKELWGWKLKNPVRSEQPINYIPKRGCVIWVNL